jgi:hypothetical protein
VAALRITPIPIGERWRVGVRVRFAGSLVEAVFRRTSAIDLLVADDQTPSPAGAAE